MAYSIRVLTPKRVLVASIGIAAASFGACGDDEVTGNCCVGGGAPTGSTSTSSSTSTKAASVGSTSTSAGGEGGEGGAGGSSGHGGAGGGDG
jgi:hypothetical protein